MTLKPFLAAPCGRILAGTVAFAALAAALIGLGAGAISPVVVPLVVMLCVVGSIMSVGLAIDSFPGITLALILALPPVGALYFAGLTLVDRTGPLSVAALAAIGLVATAMTIGVPFRGVRWHLTRRASGPGWMRR